MAGVRQDMSERSGGEILDERSCKSLRSAERSGKSQRSERSGISQRSQISEKSQRSDRSQLSETCEKLEKTENNLSLIACDVNSESKAKVDMHPLREVRKQSHLKSENES